jgi:hypothetical protein
MLGSRSVFFVLLVLMSSCTPPVIMLVNPKNGDTRRCAAEPGASSDQFFEDTRVKACVHQWRSLGYIESDKLTPEQRARLASER